MRRVSVKVPASNATPARTVLRSASVAVMVSVLAGLGGCAKFSKDHFTVGSVPSDYRTNHPIIVSQNQISEDLVVNANMKAMSHRQRNVVNEFVGRFKRAGAGHLEVMLPAGSHNAAAARRVGHDIVEFIKSERIPSSRVRVSRYHAAGHGDSATIRLAFTALDASVAEKCGQWPDDLTDTHENKNYANFGCATQNNLAEMIANPEDLLNPRGQSEIDAERRDNVINDWREGGTPALPSLL